MADVEVYLETGRSRVFACAVAWPGWARSAKAREGEEGALEALLSYAERYAEVARRAQARFPSRPRLSVVERLPGTATTDFGAPDARPALDGWPLTTGARTGQVALLQASWDLLDDVAASAPPTLAKGPRGGGRDRDDMVRHVVEAERAYARTVGVRHKPFDPADRSARDALRADLVEVLLAGPQDTAWAPAYFLRRAAWHVLDHAWEMQDKS